MTDTIKPHIRLTENHHGHLLCQVGELGVNIAFSELGHGIVNMIEQFGSHLYYGYPHKQIFLNHFYLHKRYSLIQELKNFDPETDSDISLDNVALYLYMARLSQTQKWKYPALLNRLPGGDLDQTTGGTRAFAVGLTKQNPWEHFPILLMENADKDPSVVLKDPVRVVDDKQLTELLGGAYNAEVWDPVIRLTVEIKKVKSGYSYCLLKHVDDYTLFDPSVNRGQDCLEKFTNWKKANPGRPKLKIYTNYPKSIKDINGVWDYEIVGDTGNFEQDLDARPGWLERLPRDYHVSEKAHGSDYVLWLLRDRIIDLGDLLPWMDNQFTSYVSNNWDFVMYRPDEMFSTTFIDVSYQE